MVDFSQRHAAHRGDDGQQCGADRPERHQLPVGPAAGAELGGWRGHEITLGGTPLITQIEWTPFAGAVKRWRWAMASSPKANERYFDLAGRAIRCPLGEALRGLRYDEASRIVSFTHQSTDGAAQPALDQAFGYDENDRITGITNPP